jgi:hypothetical protein
MSAHYPGVDQPLPMPPPWRPEELVVPRAPTAGERLLGAVQRFWARPVNRVSVFFLVLGWLMMPVWKMWRVAGLMFPGRWALGARWRRASLASQASLSGDGAM